MTPFEEDDRFERDLFAARARALPMPDECGSCKMTAEDAIARAESRSPRARAKTTVIHLSRATAVRCRSHASVIVALGAAAACVAWVFAGPRAHSFAIRDAMHDPAENQPIASFADTTFESTSGLACEGPSRFERLEDMSSAFLTSARAALSEDPIATRDDHDLRVCKDDSAKPSTAPAICESMRESVRSSTGTSSEIACGRDVTCEVATP